MCVCMCVHVHVLPPRELTMGYTQHMGLWHKSNLAKICRKKQKDTTLYIYASNLKTLLICWSRIPCLDKGYFQAWFPLCEKQGRWGGSPNYETKVLPPFPVACLLKGQPASFPVWRVGQPFPTLSREPKPACQGHSLSAPDPKDTSSQKMLPWSRGGNLVIWSSLLMRRLEEGLEFSWEHRGVRRTGVAVPSVLKEVRGGNFVPI